MTTTGFLRTIAHDQNGGERRAGRRQRRQAWRSVRLQAEADSGPETLLLLDRSAPQRLIARINRRWARLAARVLGPSLDGRLARGCSPESSLLLAARAQLLFSPAMRLASAQNWESLLVQARTPPVPRDPRATVNRDAILACESDIGEMLEAVVAPLPTPARGLAMVSRLLSDGTGPVYRRSEPAELAIALREATAQLDPSLSL